MSLNFSYGSERTRTRPQRPVEHPSPLQARRATRRLSNCFCRPGLRWARHRSSWPYLTEALWIKCSGPSFQGLLATSILLGLGYTFGTVGLIAYRLRPSTKGTSSVSTYLRSPYTTDCYYWEAVQLVRKVALAMASSLTKLYSPVQPVIVSSILILSLVAHTWRKPYLRPIDNIVESASLTLLLSSYMAGLIASNPQFPASANLIISWLFFVLNALFLATLTAAVLFRQAKSGIEKIKKLREEGQEEMDFWNVNDKSKPLL
jgi:hypothetical protein